LSILEGLRAAGVRTYAVTNFSREKFAVLAQHYSFLRGFDGLVVSAHEGLLKPDPRIYRCLCERYGLAAQDCFFIDDRPENVAGARAVGMWGHVFSDPPALERALRAAGVPLK
jgi:2-haloacid dehalogenase